MLALVNAILFAGYLLVFAAVAHGGKYARKPWDALREPAGSSQPSASSSSSGGGGGGGVLGTIGRIGKTIITNVPFLPF